MFDNHLLMESEIVKLLATKLLKNKKKFLMLSKQLQTKIQNKAHIL